MNNLPTAKMVAPHRGVIDNGLGSAQCSASETPQSIMSSAINDLDKATANLLSMLNQLETRLSTVLENDQEKDCIDKMPPQPLRYRVRLANDIDNIHGQVNNITARVESILGRLGV